MFGTTIIKKSKVESLQSKLETERIENSKLVDRISQLVKEIAELKSDNTQLRAKNHVLTNRNSDLEYKNTSLNQKVEELLIEVGELKKQNNYLTDAIARQYEKYHRERDEKGHFIKKSK